MAGVYLFSFLLCAWSVLPRARAQESDIAADPQRQYACGTKFTDAASSALLADVVLQGSVDDLRQASPLAPLLYKANVTVQKVYKGQELLSGGASSSRSRVRYVQVERFGPDENAENCVARVTTGQTYLFFLKIKDDQNGQRQSSSSSSASSGRSSSSVSPLSVTSTDSARAVDSAQTVFVNSALPKEMDLKVLRQAKRVLCPGCASEPVIKRLRCKNCAVRPKMRRKMSPSDTKIVRLGKRLTLRCVARAVPKPSYTWYKDGQRLGDLPKAASGSSTSTRARAATVFRSGGLSIRTTRRHSLLTVKSVTTSDQGVYRCVAANAVGEAEQTAEVLIEGNPSLAGVTPPDVTSSLCDVNICYHGGTCYNDEEGGRPRCVCTADYHGRKCQFSRRRIQPEPAEEEGGAVEGQGSEVTPAPPPPNTSQNNRNRNHAASGNTQQVDIAETGSNRGQTATDTTHRHLPIDTETDSTARTGDRITSSPLPSDTATTPSLRINKKQRRKYLTSSRGRGGYGTDVTSSDAKDSKSGAPKLKVSECAEADYCLNGGHCKIVVKIQRRFCDCPTGFVGRRCERRIS